MCIQLFDVRAGDAVPNTNSSSATLSRQKSEQSPGLSCICICCWRRRRWCFVDKIRSHCATRTTEQKIRWVCDASRNSEIALSLRMFFSFFCVQNILCRLQLLLEAHSLRGAPVNVICIVNYYLVPSTKNVLEFRMNKNKSKMWRMDQRKTIGMKRCSGISLLTSFFRCTSKYPDYADCIHFSMFTQCQPLERTHWTCNSLRCAVNGVANFLSDFQTQK